MLASPWYRTPRFCSDLSTVLYGHDEGVILVLVYSCALGFVCFDVTSPLVLPFGFSASRLEDNDGCVLS